MLLVFPLAEPNSEETSAVALSPASGRRTFLF
jgi:hypothetical protein